MTTRYEKDAESAAGAAGMSAVKFAPPVWRTPQGEAVSCIDKIKLLNENLAEIRALAQEALEDAVLMGCDESQFRDVLKDMSQNIINPFNKVRG